MFASAAGLALAGLLVLQGPPAPAAIDWAAVPVDYRDLLASYRRGPEDKAIARLLTLDRKSIQSADRPLQAATATATGRTLIRYPIHVRPRPTKLG